jgi:hypothetical protein
MGTIRRKYLNILPIVLTVKEIQGILQALLLDVNPVAQQGNVIHAFMGTT